MFLSVTGLEKLAWPLVRFVRLTHFGQDQRGVTSVMFAVSAVALLGLVGLGTEAGAWYAAKQQGQNAADAAAAAGAIALAEGGGASAAVAAATDVAGRNGFTNGGAVSVTVNTPPASGPNASNANAVEVIITQQESPLFSVLFRPGGTAIGSRAVAAVESSGAACALALAGGSGLSMGGNSTTAAKGCTLASNAPGAQSIYVYGSATVSAYTLHAVGGCSGCSGSGVTLTRPASAYQLPTTNPYAAANNVTLPSFTSCSNGSPQPYSAANPVAYCGLKLTGQTTLTLTPGTYFFTGNISIGTGSSVVCSGCDDGAGVTIVMTGSNGNAGSLNIDGNASVTLTAPTSNSFNPAFNGLLFYQDWRGSPGGITINGGATTTLIGGMYFPSAVASFNGNEDMNGNGLSTCTELIAGTIEISGNSSTTLDTSGCSKYGVNTAQLQSVRMLE
jgi:Flp pilus assembly protein TadG